MDTGFLSPISNIFKQALILRHSAPATSDVWRRAMLYREVGECGTEAVSVGACGHHADFYRAVGLHPCVAHECVFLVVERIEYLNGVEAAYGFYPYEIDRTVEGYNAPVGCMMGDYSTEVIFAVNKFYSGLYIVFMINAYHHSGLVESHLIVARHFYFCLKFAAVFGIIEGCVVNGESVV